MSHELIDRRQAPDVERRLTSRERLEEFLKTEKTGSIKSQAVADRARFDVLEQKIKTVNPLTPQILSDQWIAQHSAINETIRVRKFGENGTEYNDAFEKSKAIFQRHYIMNEIPAEGDFDLTACYDAAGTKIEMDLLRINAIKSSRVR